MQRIAYVVHFGTHSSLAEDAPTVQDPTEVTRCLELRRTLGDLSDLPERALAACISAWRRVRARMSLLWPSAPTVATHLLLHAVCSSPTVAYIASLSQQRPDARRWMEASAAR